MEMGVQVGVTDLIPLLPVPPSPHISHSHLNNHVRLGFIYRSKQLLVNPTYLKVSLILIMISLLILNI